jgi:predicted flap endonuclease-1-like 5' DNA nuclease
LKGIAIWILGVFLFLAGSNVINAVIMWFNLGPEGTFTPYLLGGLTGPIQVYVYFLVSVLVMVAFLGATSHKVVSDLSNTEQINAINENVDRLEAGQQSQQKVLESVQAKVFLVDESLERTRKEFTKGLREQADSITQSLESGHQAQQKILDSVQGQMFLLDDSLKGVKKGLNEHAELIRCVNANLVDKLGPQLADMKEAVAKQLGEVENALAIIKRREKKSEATIAKQRAEIAEITLKLEKLEGELAKPKPLLTSQSNVEDVKGIGPGKGTELKEIGITNAGELIMADPKFLAEELVSSEKAVEKLQGRAQLSMVPGLKEKGLFLLEELDIMDRKSLAEQDPIELSRKINAIFKVNLAKGKVLAADKPTIEEIDSWVKFARP